MIQEADFFGGTREISSAVDVTIAYVLGRLNLVTMTAASKKVKAEDARHFLRTGGPVYWIVNRGSNAFSFADNGGTNVVTIGVGEMAKCLLLSNSTANGSWAAKVRTVRT